MTDKARLEVLDDLIENLNLILCGDIKPFVYQMPEK